jgi:topoisomerase IA-like protein
MSYNNNNPPGRCITKHHVKYGNVYININKYNKYYIKTKINDIVNSYNIPTGYDASSLTLKEVVKIIESNDVTISNETPQGWDNLKNQTTFNNNNNNNNDNNNNNNNNNNNKGKVLGKIGNETLFLNHSKYNNKYYLKLTNTKDNIPINKDIDVDKLSFEDAKKIVDKHIQYNNKLIGTRDDKDVVLKNGCYGLYLIHDKKLYTLPKFILDKLDTLDIKLCNYIIDYQNKIKNITPTSTNEDINITDDNNIVNDVLDLTRKRIA